MFEPFKAKPLPKSTTENIYEKIIEKEKNRKKKIIERAELMLQLSELPPRMSLSNEKVKNKDGNRVSEFPFSPKINQVPNFQELQENFVKHMENKKIKKTTKSKEFLLRTSVSKSKHTEQQKILNSIEEDERQLNEMRWPYLNKRIKPPVSELYNPIQQVLFKLNRN